MMARAAEIPAQGRSGRRVSIRWPAPRVVDAERAENLLAHRYLAVLAMVALIVLGDQALVQPRLYVLATDAPVINMAGRLRMLGERLVKAALARERAATADDRERFREELDVIRIRWIAAHEGLRHGSEALSLPGRNSEVVRAAFDDIEPYFVRMGEALKRLASREAGPDRSAVELATLLQVEGAYLLRMDNVVEIYAAEARARVDQLRWTGWALTGLVLLALLGIRLFILGPAEGLIRSQVSELRKARDALEVRVRERTAELERANSDLQHEARERARAEARHRSLVEQFSHVARTNTIGEMASGLAHELNQPLGAVANYVEGCLVALDAPEPPIDEVKGALSRALDATMRTGQIIRRIRRFVTRQSSEPEVFAANRVVEDVEALFRDEAKRLGIALDLDLGEGLPPVSGDPVQVQQVLLNLVRNAAEAVTSAATPGPAVILTTRPTGSGLVEYRVTDNGEGIPPEKIGHVFDAFFSTRAHGMGMGLAISRTIVEAHHGRIGVESEPGIRTTFRFTLPPASPDADARDRLRGG